MQFSPRTHRHCPTLPQLPLLRDRLGLVSPQCRGLWERYAVLLSAALLGNARHLHRAHAACIATPHAPCRCVALSPCGGCERSGTPRARASAARGFRRLRAGPLFCSPQPSREPQRYAPSSPPAASGLRALRAAQHCRPLLRLRLPRGGTPQGTLSAQQSADRSTRPDDRVAPASGWAASTVYSPVGPRNEPSLRFGLLAFAPSALYR